MSIFDKEIRLFKSIEQEIIPTVIGAIKRYDFVLLDYNTNKQMNIKGEDAKGEHIGNYSAGYKRIRIKRGLQTEHVDLHFTGKFQATLEIITNDKEFIIKSNVDYANAITKRYGKDVLGIKEENLKQFVFNYIVPEIRKMINSKIQSYV